MRIDRLHYCEISYFYSFGQRKQKAEKSPQRQKKTQFLAEKEIRLRLLAKILMNKSENAFFWIILDERHVARP